jgi:hypothetical protein
MTLTLSEMIATPTTGTLVELDCREDSDHKVQLFWQPVTKRVFIRITETVGEIITRQVPNDEARHAFLHPYVYCD